LDPLALQAKKENMRLINNHWPNTTW